MQNQNEAHEIGQTNLEERGHGKTNRTHMMGRRKGILRTDHYSKDGGWETGERSE